MLNSFMILLNGIFIGMILSSAIISIHETISHRKKARELEDETRQALETHKNLLEALEKQRKEAFDRHIKEHE